MSMIRAGELAIYSGPNSVTSRIRLEGGFAEVNERGLTVLAEAAEEVA
jgi:F-type H+-transporting ATPase subunit epsilon